MGEPAPPHEAPLWQRVLADLRDRLVRGEFRQRFPTDRELMETYDVSRHTVREAVRRLQGDGLVRRERGRGSFVTGGGFEQPLGTVYSLFRTIEASGASQVSVVLALEDQINPQAAAVLGLDGDDPVLYLERIRLADGEPLAYDRAWLPLDEARPLLESDFSHTALYDELIRVCGCSPDRGSERIRPVVPVPAVARYLDLPPGEPALEIDRRTFSDGSPLEWRITIVRGDRYAFVAEWDGRAADAAPRLVPG